MLLPSRGLLPQRFGVTWSQRHASKLSMMLKPGASKSSPAAEFLSEGYDEPSINVILMCRPTKSAALYTQCIGRGLRLWPGKADCLVLDFSDRSHNLDNIVSLGYAIPEALTIKDEQERPEEQEEIDKRSKIEVLEDVDREFDILGCARFIWIPIGDDEWSLYDDEKREIIIRPFESGYVAFLYSPDGPHSKS